MIVLGVSHQMPLVVLGHYVIRNVTMFQNCRSDNKFLIGEKVPRKHFDKNNTSGP